MVLTGEDTSNKQKIGSHIKFFKRKYNNPIYSYYGDKAKFYENNYHSIKAFLLELPVTKYI